MCYVNQFINNIFFLFLGVLISYKMELILGYLSNCFDELLLFKINMKRKYEARVNFNSHYCNLDYYIIHKNHFIKIENQSQNKKIFNFILFQDLFKYYKFEPEPDSVIILRFKYKNNYYRKYINYKQVLDGYTLELPIDPKKIIDIHEEKISKKKLYFLKNETNEIEYATINGQDCLELVKECNGLFHDFGVIDNNVIKIKYLMNELDINELKQFKLKYKNFHLDEEKIELVEHITEIQDNEELIMSNLMKEIIIES